jgi:hypothetical protein
MKTTIHLRLLVVLGLLSGALPAQAAHLVPEVGTIPAESTAPADLLQFASGGHALGFAAGGMYAAAGDHALHVEFVGANAVRPQSDSPATPSTLLRTGGDGQAAQLSRLTYAGLWDGITLTYSAGAGSIYTTTYTLASGADPAAIRLVYNTPPVLNADGTLGIAFATGALTETAPAAWQMIAGRRVPVDASFSIRGREVAFALGSYDPRFPLTIDPALVWNTFLGGSANEYGGDIVVDSAGNLYVAGTSGGTWGSPVRAFTGNFDVFVAKLNSSGALIWNTFLGSADSDEGYDVAVDGQGNVYVTGYSAATWGSPVRTHAGGQDAFVAKLNSTGSLVWNTFLGAAGTDAGHGIAVDGSGVVYLTGNSAGTWGSPLQSFAGVVDAFAAKLSSSGALTWNTFLGGIDIDYGYGIALDDSGNVYVSGYGDTSWGSPVHAFTGSYDAFAAKLTSSGALSWNTFLGGSNSEFGKSIAFQDGYLYIAGYCFATWGSPARAYGGGSADAFAVELRASNGILVWNTFLGGSGTDYGYAVAVDRGGKVYVSGYSTATWGSPLRAYTAGNDAFAARIDSSGNLLAHIFLGGGGDDNGTGIVYDGSGTYVNGDSTDTWGSPVRAFTSFSDGFVARVNLPHACSIEGSRLFDFSSDCATDVAVFRPSTGAWYIRNEYSTYYGASGDIPVPGDYNGDGTTDIAVYRPSTGAWYIRNQYSAYYGVSTDRPVPGDYDGDGTADIAVYRPSTGAWYVRNQATVYYGVSTDIPVPGDYDGNGTTDIAVYRPSTGAWYIRNQFSAFYGVSTDIPVPGKYIGNDKTEIAVFRPSTGAWYVRDTFSVYYGASGDIPLPEMGTGNAGSAP